LAIDEGLRGPDRLSGQSDRVAKPGVEISTRHEIDDAGGQSLKVEMCN
jgi:hypothetical protein